ncbi:MAG: signal peptide peptidase SppA [Clostridia bacterium]|nr:signal peptide peptidase SppA [Clostridia bacterium]
MEEKYDFSPETEKPAVESTPQPEAQAGPASQPGYGPQAGPQAGFGPKTGRNPYEGPRMEPGWTPGYRPEPGNAPYGQQGVGSTYYYNPGGAGTITVEQKPGMAGWKKGLIIFLIVVLVVVAAGYGCTRMVKNAFDEYGAAFNTKTESDTIAFDDDYVGLLYLEGTISDGESGDGYNQDWILDAVDQMMDDPHNKGILMHVNTPGGSAYATAELYRELQIYKEETGRPIYVYMGSQATSGGYYASMAADKIWANPECWTGSIGVIVGTLYDYSELLDKLGVKAYSITSGPNKDLGARYHPMTAEQEEILQSLVDDSYDHFIEAVCAGRGLDEQTARKLGDGRIYTAKQAKENGLIDEVGYLEDECDAMCKDCGFSEDIDFQVISYTPEFNLFSNLIGFASDMPKGEYAELLDKLTEEQTIEIQYLAPVRK